MHSARWDDSYDFTGKKVACIGIGSSAIQIVPNLAKGIGFSSDRIEIRQLSIGNSGRKYGLLRPESNLD